MTDTERDTSSTQPIDESTYAGSSSETGGNYSEEGATSANTEGDSMAIDELEDNPGPGADPGMAFGDAVSAGEAQPDEEGGASPDVGDVYRSGS